jgi:hypothetical protein
MKLPPLLSWTRKETQVSYIVSQLGSRTTAYILGLPENETLTLKKWMQGWESPDEETKARISSVSELVRKASLYLESKEMLRAKMWQRTKVLDGRSIAEVLRDGRVPAELLRLIIHDLSTRSNLGPLA